eukprot:g3936.t1
MDLFGSVRKFYPDWKPDMVKNRRDLTTAAIGKTRTKASEQIKKDKGVIAELEGGERAQAAVFPNSEVVPLSKGILEVEPLQKRRLDDAAAEVERLRKELAAAGQKRKLEANAGGDSTQASRDASRVNDLRKMNEALSGKLRAAEANLEAMRARMAAAPVENEVKALNQRIERLEQEREAMGMALKTSRGDHTEALSKIEILTADMEIMREQAEELRQKEANLERDLQTERAVANEVVAGQRRQMEALEKNLEEKSRQLKAANEQISSLKQELDESRAAYQELWQEKEALLMERDQMSALLKLNESGRIEELIEQNMGLAKSLREANERVERMSKDSNAAKDDVIDALRDLAIAKSQINRLHQEKKDQDKRMEELRQRLRDEEMALMGGMVQADPAEVEMLREVIQRQLRVQERRNQAKELLVEAARSLGKEDESLNEAIKLFDGAELELSEEERELVADQQVDGEFISPFARDRKTVGMATSQLNKELESYDRAATKAYLAGRLLPTRELYEIMIEQHPGHVPALCKLGVVQMKLGETAKAVEAFQKAFELDNDNAYANRMLGFSYLKMGDMASAELYVQRAVELAPDDARSYLVLGTIDFQMNRLESAEANFKSSISVDPVPSEPYFNLAILHVKLGSCANDEADSARPTEQAAGPKSLSERLSETNGYTQDEDGNWTVKSDKRSQYDSQRDSAYFKGKIEKDQYKTGSYAKKSWWGSKDYGKQEYSGNTDGSRFMTEARQAGQQARFDGQTANVKGKFETNTLGREAARESGFSAIDKPSSSSVESARSSYKAPSIVGWQEQREMSAMASARANARMALMLALGKLQETGGPDQRITATASLMGDSANNYAGGTDPASGHSSWVGVWKSGTVRMPGEASEAYDPARPDDREFLGWLVSSESPADVEDLGYAGASIADEVEIFKGIDAASSVMVPKVPVTDSNGLPGSYAYWVEDEGVKADISWSEDEFADTERKQANRLSAIPGPDFDVFGGPFSGKTNYPLEQQGTWLEDLEKATSPADIPLVVNAPADYDWLDEKRHDITLHSRGVLADVQRGGLRRDLSLAFEMDGDADISGSEQPAKFNSQEEFAGGSDRLTSTGSAPGMPVRERYLWRDTKNSDGPFSGDIVRSDAVLRGPTWWALRDYANLYKRLRKSGSNYTLDARARYPNTSAGVTLWVTKGTQTEEKYGPTQLREYLTKNSGSSISDGISYLLRDPNGPITMEPGEPANFGTDPSGNRLDATPMEGLTQFNPLASLYATDVWHATHPSSLFMTVSSTSSNDLYNNYGINFPTNDNGNWGEAYSSSGSTHVPLLDIPASPPISLAAFSHANLGVITSDPMRMVANSRTSPFVNPKSIYQEVKTYENTPTAQDSSWQANNALFDRYFLSGLAPAYSIGSGGYNETGSLEDTIEKFYSDDFREALANPVLMPHIPLGKTEEEIIDELGEDDGYKKLAAYSLVNGVFNVNSTSVAAWEAFLRGNRDLAVNYASGSAESSGGVPFPSGTSPSEQGSGSNQYWAGFARLDNTQISALATAIVEQVKLRGPFMSLADFVNHRVGTPVNQDTHYAGALQAAIDLSGINGSVSSAGGGIATAYPTGSSEIFGSGGVPSDMGDRTTASGIPGEITQADLLLPLAPRLTSRSDSFRIRAYGETLSKDGTTVVARAVCEAVVQRMPEYMDPDTDADNNLPWSEAWGANNTPWSTNTPTTSSLNEMNQTYGRRFKIVGFRWLHSTEV